MAFDVERAWARVQDVVGSRLKLGTQEEVTVQAGSENSEPGDCQIFIVRAPPT